MKDRLVWYVDHVAANDVMRNPYNINAIMCAEYEDPSWGMFDMIKTRAALKRGMPARAKTRVFQIA